MKIRIFHSIAPITLASIITLSGCSTAPAPTYVSEAKVAPTGPTVMNARSSPATVELDAQLQAKYNPQILADIKDFTSPVNKVTLRFMDVPIEIEMNNLQGTTWQATLTPEQVKKLAVSGKSIKYFLEIIATDEQGRSASSPEPVQIVIKAPELARATS